jgi:hypothetical protein
MELGMPVNLKGFTYITDAVMLLDTPEWKNPKWTALYYKIASMHKDTPARVERAIRSALASTRNRSWNYEMVDRYLGFKNCENSNSITYLYMSIKRDINNGIALDQIGFINERGVQITSPSALPEGTKQLLEEIVRETLRDIMIKMA